MSQESGDGVALPLPLTLTVVGLTLRGDRLLGADCLLIMSIPSFLQYLTISELCSILDTRY